MKTYKPKSSRNLYTAGKPYKLSRSKIQLFLDCPRCFYLDRKLGLRKPPEIPFNLNLAVDRLLKNEFDHYRKLQTPHPLLTKNNIDATPFQHKDLDTWRENFQGITYHHPETNLIISGAVDDIWVNNHQELIIVDYKATAKNINLNSIDKIHPNNLKQLDIYTWLFQKNNFKTAQNSYFLYCNVNRQQTTFQNKLNFDINLIPYQADPSWIEQTLAEIKQTLDALNTPNHTQTCNHCLYLKANNHQESIQTLF